VRMRKARIQAVLLAAREIATEAMAKLSQASALQQANPDWPNQPRDPPGSPGGGRWMSDEGGSGEDAIAQPAAGRANEA